jgi:hypothetical protein
MDTCPAILKTGPRAGQPCGKPNCSRHRPDNVLLHKKSGTQEGFLEAYAKVGNITRAADMVGISRQSHYDWMAGDPAYEPKFRQAMREATDVLREAAWTRAVDGVETTIFDKNGVAVGESVKYSDTLLIFLMKAASPGEFRDNYRVQVEGSIEHTHRLDWESSEQGMLSAAERRLGAIEARSVETEPD